MTRYTYLDSRSPSYQRCFSGLPLQYAPCLVAIYSMFSNRTDWGQSIIPRSSAIQSGVATGFRQRDFPPGGPPFRPLWLQPLIKQGSLGERAVSCTEEDYR